jgi:hypothetical protein
VPRPGWIIWTCYDGAHDLWTFYYFWLLRLGRIAWVIGYWGRVLDKADVPKVFVLDELPGYYKSILVKMPVIKAFILE